MANADVATSSLPSPSKSARTSPYASPCGKTVGIGGEIPEPVAEAHGDLPGEEARGHEIGMAVAVDVADREPARGHGHGDRRRESAETVAEADADGVVARVGDVAMPVAVEVLHDRARRGAAPDRESRGRAERSVAGVHQRGEGRALPVRDDDVGLAVAGEVGRHDVERLRVAARRLTRTEVPAAEPLENGQEAREGAIRRQRVQRAVPVQVGERDGRGAPTGRDGLEGEAARAVAHSDAHAVAVARHEVGDPVAVEIRDGEGAGPESEEETPSRPEPARPVAETNVERAELVADRREVGLAVPVQIGHGVAARVRPDRKCEGGAEPSRAVSREKDRVVGTQCGRDDVELPVARGVGDEDRAVAVEVVEEDGRRRTGGRTHKDGETRVAERDGDVRITVLVQVSDADRSGVSRDPRRNHPDRWRASVPVPAEHGDVAVGAHPDHVEVAVAIHVPDADRQGNGSSREIRLDEEAPVPAAEEYRGALAEDSDREVRPSVLVEVADRDLDVQVHVLHRRHERGGKVAGALPEEDRDGLSRCARRRRESRRR